MKNNFLIIKLDKPYKFEDQTYKEIDLSGLETLKTIDIIECQNNFNKRGKFDSIIEFNVDYCVHIASRVTNIPVEFFYNLPAKYATVIKHKVGGFLLQAG